jgi:hypothetical protein
MHVKLYVALVKKISHAQHRPRVGGLIQWLVSLLSMHEEQLPLRGTCIGICTHIAIQACMHTLLKVAPTPIDGVLAPGGGRGTCIVQASSCCLYKHVVCCPVLHRLFPLLASALVVVHIVHPCSSLCCCSWPLLH